MTCREYQRQSGILIPAFCEVAWLMPEGRVPYWRGQVIEIGYDLAR